MIGETADTTASFAVAEDTPAFCARAEDIISSTHYRGHRQGWRSMIPCVERHDASPRPTARQEYTASDNITKNSSSNTATHNNTDPRQSSTSPKTLHASQKTTENTHNPPTTLLQGTTVNTTNSREKVQIFHKSQPRKNQNRLESIEIFFQARCSSKPHAYSCFSRDFCCLGNHCRKSWVFILMRFDPGILDYSVPLTP